MEFVPVFVIEQYIYITPSNFIQQKQYLCWHFIEMSNFIYFVIKIDWLFYDHK